MAAPVPFVLGQRTIAERLAARCTEGNCTVIDVLADESRPMFELLLAANAKSYGGLAMPAWVQLDCAALPAGVIGFARPRAVIANYDELVTFVRPTAQQLLRDYDGLVPVAQYTCVPTPEAGHVVGFSLWSLERGLGALVKRMALDMHQAQVQTGIVQLDSPALKSHLRLGPLRVVSASLSMHERGDVTVVYALERDRTLPAGNVQRTAKVVARAAIAHELPTHDVWLVGVSATEVEWMAVMR